MRNIGQINIKREFVDYFDDMISNMVTFWGDLIPNVADDLIDVLATDRNHPVVDQAELLFRRNHKLCRQNGDIEFRPISLSLEGLRGLIKANGFGKLLFNNSCSVAGVNGPTDILLERIFRSKLATMYSVDLRDTAQWVLTNHVDWFRGNTVEFWKERVTALSERAHDMHTYDATNDFLLDFSVVVKAVISHIRERDAGIGVLVGEWCCAEVHYAFWKEKERRDELHRRIGHRPLDNIRLMARRYADLSSKFFDEAKTT